MYLETRDILRVHACAFNGRDVESVAAHGAATTACFSDGKWVGEGPEAIRRLLEAEYARHDDMIAKVDEENGEPVIVEFGPDGQDRHATVRIHSRPTDGCIREIHVTHLSSPLRRPDVPRPGR